MADRQRYSHFPGKVRSGGCSNSPVPMSQRREVNYTVHTREAVLEGLLELHEKAWRIKRLVSITCYGSFPARGRI